MARRCAYPPATSRSIVATEWTPPEGAEPNRWAFQRIATGTAPDGELPPPREDSTLRRRLPFRTTDLLGRAQLRRYSIPRLCSDAIPVIASERIRRVPARAIEEEGVEPSDGSEFALVHCPCGHRPVVGAFFGKCSCERAYVTFGGGRVFVFYLDMEIPSRS